MNYKGIQPCHGCGLTGKQRERCEKDALCHTCQNYIRAGKIAISDQNEVRVVTVMLSSAVHKLIYRPSGKEGGLYKQGFYHSFSCLSKREYSDINNEIIMQAMANYLRSIKLTSNDKFIEVGYMHFDNDGHGERFYITEENAIAFLDMMLKFHEFSAKNFEAGQNHGKSLIHAMIRKEKELYAF